MPNTKEVEQSAFEKELNSIKVLLIDKNCFTADSATRLARQFFQHGYECALSNPLEQSEPFGYVFEGKFYKEVPERTFFEGNEPVAVYLSREQ